MAASNEILLDGFARVKEAVHAAASGLGVEELTYRVDGEANTIGWLVWHLARVQDDHVAEAASIEQRWTAGGWAERFALPFPVGATGYGHRAEEVGQVRADADVLVGYYDAVHQVSERFVATLADDDLNRVVDESWEPPVTLGVRLVSVLQDDLMHAGQAAFLRGLVERRWRA